MRQRCKRSWRRVIRSTGQRHMQARPAAIATVYHKTNLHLKVWVLPQVRGQYGRIPPEQLCRLGGIKVTLHQVRVVGMHFPCSRTVQQQRAGRKLLPASKMTGMDADPLPVSKTTGMDADPLPASKTTGMDADPLPASKTTGMDADPLPASKTTGMDANPLLAAGEMGAGSQNTALVYCIHARRGICTLFENKILSPD